jgi:hypothetical protein
MDPSPTCMTRASLLFALSHLQKIERERMATDPQVAALKIGATRLENLHFLSLRSITHYNTGSYYLLTALRKLHVFYALHHAVKHDLIRQLTSWVGSKCTNREFNNIAAAIGRVQKYL